MSDQAIAIGEDAFKAGWEARERCAALDGDVHEAWSAYTPPETLCGLEPDFVLRDDAIDAAYSAMCEELDRWELVGPMRAVPSGEVRHGKPVMVEPWLVRSTTNRPDFTKEVLEISFEQQKFTDKAHAVAFIQWNGLKAALNQFAASATSGQGSDTPNSAEHPTA